MRATLLSQVLQTVLQRRRNVTVISNVPLLQQNPRECRNWGNQPMSEQSPNPAVLSKERLITM